MSCLHQQLELLDLKLEEEADHLHKHGGALRHLEEQRKILHANTYMDVTSNQQHHQKQISFFLKCYSNSWHVSVKFPLLANNNTEHLII